MPASRRRLEGLQLDVVAGRRSRDGLRDARVSVAMIKVAARVVIANPGRERGQGFSMTIGSDRSGQNRLGHRPQTFKSPR